MRAALYYFLLWTSYLLLATAEVKAVLNVFRQPEGVGTSRGPRSVSLGPLVTLYAVGAGVSPCVGMWVEGTPPPKLVFYSIT